MDRYGSRGALLRHWGEESLAPRAPSGGTAPLPIPCKSCDNDWERDRVLREGTGDPVTICCELNTSS